MTDQEMWKREIDSKYGRGAYDTMATDAIRKDAYDRIINAKNAQSTAALEANKTTNTTPAATSTGNTTTSGAYRGTSGNTSYDYSSYLSNMPKYPEYSQPDYSEMLYQKRLDTLKEQLTRGREEAQRTYDSAVGNLNTNTDKALAEAYVAKMNGQRNLAQQLAAAGISGGGAESTLLGLENSYANNRASLESQRQDSLKELAASLMSQKNSLQDSYNTAEASAYADKLNMLSQQLAAQREADLAKWQAELSAYNKGYGSSYTQSPEYSEAVGASGGTSGGTSGGNLTTANISGQNKNRLNLSELVQQLRQQRPGISDEELTRIANSLVWR